MKPLAKALFGMLLLVWTAAACVPDIQEPEVRLAGVRLGGVGLEGGLLYVRLSVINPNSFGLEAAGLTYDLDLSEPGDGRQEWADVATGTFREDVRVGANDSTVLEIPVEFTYRGLGGAVQSVLRTGTVDYRVQGTVMLREPISTEIPYRHSGTVAVLSSR